MSRAFRFAGSILVGLSVLTACVYIFRVVTNPGIGDTFDPATGPVAVYNFGIGEGGEILIALILLGLLVGGIFLATASKEERDKW